MTRSNLFHFFSSSSSHTHSLRNRRGQAAFEFLSTYGFATLMLLLTLGALSYFGFFNTASLRSSSCSFPQGFSCNDYIINTASNPVSGSTGPHVRVNVTNEYGVNMTLSAIRLTTTNTQTERGCNHYPSFSPASPWTPGASTIFWCAIPAGEYIEGEFYEGTFVVNFTQSGGSYVHTVRGRVAARMQ